MADDLLAIDRLDELIHGNIGEREDAIMAALRTVASNS